MSSPDSATTRASAIAPAALCAALADRYVIERQLGVGGMATVYGARDLRHRRQVAIKVMHAEVAAALGADRFLREIEIVAGLNHPHILPLYDSGEAAGFLYYVMPLVEGLTLRELLTANSPMPLADCVRLLRDIVEALAFAHSKGIVHRDVKPENVLLSGGHASAPSVDRKNYRIAVLPFDNLSAEGDEFFTDGITRDINSRLSRISGFTVIAHGSAERLQHVTYAEIAKRLKVDYVIDGSVTRAGNRCRILVSLIDPSTDVQLWNQDYDRDITIANLLEARSSVAANVAQALNLTLTPGERSEPTPTQNFDAYRAFQLGRFYAAKRTVPGLKTAREHFERAVALDPGYALAHAGLADVHVLLPFFDRGTSSRDSLPRAAAGRRGGVRTDGRAATDPRGRSRGLRRGGLCRPQLSSLDGAPRPGHHLHRAWLRRGASSRGDGGRVSVVQPFALESAIPRAAREGGAAAVTYEITK